MPRIRFEDQAAAVMRFVPYVCEAPDPQADRFMVQVQNRALCALRSARSGPSDPGPAAHLDRSGQIKVWVRGTSDLVICFAIQARRTPDGEWFDPLSIGASLAKAAEAPEDQREREARR